MDSKLQKELSGFELLDHPADMGFSAWAPNMASLYAESAKALTSVIVDPNKVQLTNSIERTIEGEDPENLMFNWLSDILYLFDGEKQLFANFEVVEFNEDPETYQMQMRVILKGEPYNQEKHQINTYVKAITLHQLEVKRTKEGYAAKVFLDI